MNTAEDPMHPKNTHAYQKSHIGSLARDLVSCRVRCKLTALAFLDPQPNLSRPRKSF